MTDQPTEQPVPSYPCPECPVVRGEFCWTCPLPFEHLLIKPLCEICKAETATVGLVTPTTTAGEFGITYKGFMNIPICDSSDCLEIARWLQGMAV